MTPELARKFLRYDRDSGKLFWNPREVLTFRDKGWNTVHANKEAGRVSAIGYVYVTILRKQYLAHRLAWMIEYGEYPPPEIDHVNHVRHDNRIDNLRSADRDINTKNLSAPITNTSGYVGVYWHKGAQKWMAQIAVDRRSIYLGLYSSPKSAHEARLKAENYYGFHANHGEFAQAA